MLRLLLSLLKLLILTIAYRNSNLTLTKIKTNMAKLRVLIGKLRADVYSVMEIFAFITIVY